MNKKFNIFHKVLGTVFPRFRPYYSYFDYYENQLEQFSLNNLISLFSKNNINNINSSEEVSFYKFQFLSESKDIIKKLGEPRFKSSHPQIEGLIGLFFRKKLGDSKVTVMFLFFQNKLIFGSYIFDHFNSTSYKKLENLLHCKYASAHDTSTAITDSNYNRIEFIFDVDHRINFICGNPSVQQALILQQKRTEKFSDNRIWIAFSDFI